MGPPPKRLRGADILLWAALDESEKRRALLMRDGRPFHVLLSQQFSRPQIESLCDTATAIRRLDRHVDGRDFLRGVLRGYRIMNLFAQPSTRTAESFVAAADKLGASSRLVSDLRTSSFAKGETVEDSVRTLSSFFDAIVTRHQDDDFATRAEATEALADAWDRLGLHHEAARLIVDFERRASSPGVSETEAADRRR